MNQFSERKSPTNHTFQKQTSASTEALGLMLSRWPCAHKERETQGLFPTFTTDATNIFNLPSQSAAP